MKKKIIKSGVISTIGAILAIACVILLLEESGTRMKGTYGVIIATVAAALMEITDASMRKITKEDIIIVGGMTLAAI